MKSLRSNYCSFWQLDDVSQWCSLSRLYGYCHWWLSRFFSGFIHYTSKLRANEQHGSFSFSFLIWRFRAVVITFYAFMCDGNFWCWFLKLLQQQNVHTLLCWKIHKQVVSAALSCYSLWIYLGHCKNVIKGCNFWHWTDTKSTVPACGEFIAITGTRGYECFLTLLFEFATLSV